MPTGRRSSLAWVLTKLKEPRVGDSWNSAICLYCNKENLATLKP
jgi:hypothetical protein